MLSIQCDDTTAAAIIIDDANEISMSEEDWEIAGRPTIGDTIFFDVPGDGMFVDAFNGLRYLITDEYERDGNHIVSFTEVSHEGNTASHESWVPHGNACVEMGDDATDDGTESHDMDTLRFFPGIIAPDDNLVEMADDEDEPADSDSVQHVPTKPILSMRLISVLMQEHGMSVHDIAAGLIALEKESTVPLTNEDVIVDFFTQNAERISSRPSQPTDGSKKPSNGSSTGNTQEIRLR